MLERGRFISPSALFPVLRTESYAVVTCFWWASYHPRWRWRSGPWSTLQTLVYDLGAQPARSSRPIPRPPRPQKLPPKNNTRASAEGSPPLFYGAPNRRTWGQREKTQRVGPRGIRTHRNHGYGGLSVLNGFWCRLYARFRLHPPAASLRRLAIADTEALSQMKAPGGWLSFTSGTCDGKGADAETRGSVTRPSEGL